MTYRTTSKVTPQGASVPNAVMSKLQEEIDAVIWYHEFDFGNGLVARSNTSDVAYHRRSWRFIERQLAAVDFHGKSVLDIGCWDGYWSFYAERRGAASVLASDDVTQNWAAGEGLRLAKRLLNSRVEIKQDVSVYHLERLGRTFDVILCLGVYYHLLDPFYGFAQIRHCCHADTLVIFEGAVGRYDLRPSEARYFRGATFLPSKRALNNLLRAAYLEVRYQQFQDSTPRRWIKTALGRLLQRFGRPTVDRGFTVCAPFTGANHLHHYQPPFGLVRFDDRYSRPQP